MFVHFNIGGVSTRALVVTWAQKLIELVHTLRLKMDQIEYANRIQSE